MLITAPTQAQERNVGYVFSPAVEWFQGDNNSGLRPDPLYGGELGLNLGRYMEVSGEFLYGPNFETDFTQFDELSGLIDREVDLMRYGGRIRTNLRAEGVIPYLSLGVGVLKFDPDGASSSQTIYSNAGAGITYSFANRYRVSLGGEVLSYRYNPSTTFFGPESSVTATGEERVINPSARASVALFLGGRSLDEETAIDASFREQFAGGLSTLRLSVDPFISRIEWNEALGMPRDQTMGGANVGFQLGSTISLHGFYARGREGTGLFDEITSTSFENIQMYGSEVRLRLVPQPPDRPARLSPYAILGGGYLDILSGYGDDIPEDAIVPNDRYFATAGVGLDVPIGETLGLTGSVRSIFMNAQDSPTTSDTDIYGSLTYSIGVSFGIGGRDRQARRTAPQVVVAEAEETVPETEEAAPPAMTQRDRLQARLDSLEQRAEERELERRIERIEQQMIDGELSPAADTLQQERAVIEEQPRRSNLSGQSMTVPVPEVGAVYIRFGEGSPEVQRLDPGEQPRTDTPRVRNELSQEDIGRAVREALGERIGDDEERALTDEDVERTVQRALRDLLDRDERDRRREEDRREEDRRADDRVTEDRPVDDRRVDEMRNQLDEMRRQMRRQQEELERTRRALREESQRDIREEPRRDLDRDTPRSVRGRPFYSSFLGRPLTSVVPLTGFRAGGGPTQYQLGIRADYRQTPVSNFRFLPEVAIATSPSTTSLAITGNVAYTFGRDFAIEQTGQPIEPYAGVGLGLASARALRLGIVTNAFFGAEYPLGSGALFAEYSTFNTFEVSRFLFGYRLPL